MTKSLVFLGCVVAIGAIAGCGGSGGGSLAAPDPKIFYVNASADSGNLDFANDDSILASNLAPLKVSSIATVKSGDHDNVVNNAGTSTTLDALATAFSSDTSYVITAVGQAKPDSNDSNASSKQIQLAATAIDVRTPTGSKARVIFIQSFNRASGFGTPQVDFTPPGDNVAAGSKIAAIDPGTIKSFDIDITNNNFELRRSGTDQVYIAPTTLSLSAGGIYVVIASGVENQTGAQGPTFTVLQLK